MKLGVVLNYSLQKAFKIVWLVGNHQGELGLSDICRRLHMNKTTVFRYIETLIYLNILEKHRDTYYLGIGLAVLGGKVRIQAEIIEWIHPILVLLAHEVNETVNFAQLSGNTALYLDRVESERGLQMKAVLGANLPCHCTALGKAILAILDPDKAEELLSAVELKKMTKSTITDPALLMKQIESMRRRDYYSEREEFDDELTCVAVPLKVPELNFIGGISISGPIYRLDQDRLSFLAQRLKKTRDEIVKRLKTSFGGTHSA